MFGVTYLYTRLASEINVTHKNKKADIIGK